MAIKNKYTHSIELKTLSIKNDNRDQFAKKLEEIPYRGYQVEDISDGRKIVIAKPGGKRAASGHTKKEDFFVFIYDPTEQSLWQISHGQIKKDLEQKAEANNTETIKILESLERVYNGEEPDDVISDRPLSNPSGEIPEVLMKAYKWIWGQEDVNYPSPLEGRGMSWAPLKTLLDDLIKE